MEHRDAAPGKAGKYARIERERRFLMGALPDGPCVRRATIADRYIEGTRLRLRRSVEVTAAGTTTARKLTQKIPSPEGGLGLITTFYLDETEYEVLAAAPAAVLTKTRYSVPPLGVDVFDGRLAGLVMAEVEFDRADEEARFPVPAGTVAEVTLDASFSGGALATTDRSELLVWLARFGLQPLDASALEKRPLSPLGEHPDVPVTREEVHEPSGEHGPVIGHQEQGECHVQ
jgi:CYTH domain-containing protein